MTAYLIVEHKITDAAKFEEYRAKVGPMIAKHGGRSLTKGGTHKLPEGGHWKPELVVIIEFPDMDSLNAWYNSPEYQPLIALPFVKIYKRPCWSQTASDIDTVSADSLKTLDLDRPIREADMETLRVRATSGNLTAL